MPCLRDSPSAGFRLSILDIVVLIVAFGSSVAFCITQPWIAILIAFVVGHFFLFCNVFRISRIAELIWAAVTVSLWGSIAFVEDPDWRVFLTANLLWTLLTISVEIRRSCYHGAWWQTLNPSLALERNTDSQRNA